jgi:hypothetical protein
LIAAVQKADADFEAKVTKLIAVVGVGRQTAWTVHGGPGRAAQNHVLKAVYQRLRQAGKPPKLAITAVMRKLLLLLNSILKNPDFKRQTA